MKPASAIGCPSGILTCAGQILTGWNYYTTFEPEPELPPPPLGAAELGFNDQNNINNFQGGICVKTYLDDNEKALLNKGGILKNRWGEIKNKFKNPDGKAEGCVAVSWEKKTYRSNNKWRGALRYEWLYKIGTEALVVYGVYNPDDMTLKLSWRAIYINRKTNGSAWNVWFSEKADAPKHPAFLRGKSWLWGYSPVWGCSCRWLNSVCEGELKEEKSDEIKLTWKEDERGDQLFTDWSLNFWGAFKDFINDSAGPLTELQSLTKREGIWHFR